MRTGLKTRAVGRLAIVAIGLLALVGFYASGASQRFSRWNLREGLAPFRARVDTHPVTSATAYTAVYIVAAALSLPVGAGMTLTAGAIFGRVLGTVVAAIGSTVGATLAMLSARYILADRVRNRFGERLKTLDERLAREGAFYLFLLRIVPVVPFFVINLMMGLTRIRVVPYVVTSALGMLPVTILYVNAGAEFANVERPGQILSPGILASFSMLGLTPLLLRKAMERWKPSGIDMR